MSSISGSVINTTFSYDANGNLTSGNGVSLTYASFNKPETIARGSALISFAHDTEHQRFKQISSAGETLYLADAGVMAERLAGSGGVTQWTNYLFAGSEMIGMRVERSDGSTYTRYFHKDHLGSIATITDETGAVVERLSYDAWGKRRFPNGQDDPTGSISSQTTRGFTGQEELADVGLVHMNGRVYDPLLGRFGTPDPTTENPFSTQGWNRYSYVGNSPLNFTDPSGYCFAGCFWQAPFKALGGLLRRIPILGNILTAAAGAFCTPFGLGPVCATLASAAVTGLASGKLGLALKAGLISAATAFAMFEVGQLTFHNPPFGTPEYVANVIGHAAVGCASSVASGGKCGPGALSAGVGAAATPLVMAEFPNPRTNVNDLAGGTAAEFVVGGVASVAGGGKFGNGAVTAAFGYLFNAIGDRPSPPPGYDPKTWQYSPVEYDLGEIRNCLIDPDGIWHWEHPEDEGHWAHWDTEDPNDPRGRAGGDRWPDDPGKPRPGQKNLGAGQSWTDPNGDGPRWKPPIQSDMVIVPSPLAPGLRLPILRVPTPMFEIPAFP